MTGLAMQADALVKGFKYLPRSWEDLRDAIDLKTGSQLDGTQLDILTDMVRDRLLRRHLKQFNKDQDT